MRTTGKYWPWWRWIMTGLNLLALVMCAIMSWHYLTGRSIVGCGVGSPCEQVLSSRWSMIAGTLPVSGLAMGVYLAMLVIWRSVTDSSKDILRPLPEMVRVLIGLILAGILAAFQVGSPDAPYVVTLLFDYQCSHCQKIHFMLDEAIRRYDGKLAFALFLTPLNTECNPYIKIIFGSQWVIPEVYNANDLFMILQKSLAVPMP